MEFLWYGEEEGNDSSESGCDYESTSYEPEEVIKSPQTFNQAELNDLARDLNISKDAAQLLTSSLKDKHLIKNNITFSYYRQREKEFRNFVY